MTDRPNDDDGSDEETAEDGLDDAVDETAPGDENGTIPQDMIELLDETADLAEPVEVVPGPAGTGYRLGGREFAWAGGLVFEVQLGPEVATAALRTPDVTVSGRGAGWIRLQPAVIDDHAADRVVAWFELARRIAAGRQGGGGGSRRH